MGTTERLAHRDIVPGLVSVVLPVKNGERFIGSALDSVQRQTYGNHEILVVDGNSSDRTDEIVKSFSGVLWIPQETGGVTEGFNTGVRASRGEFVAFISHDDLWEPTKLEQQVGFLTAHPAIDFVTCRLRFFLSEGFGLPPGFRPHLLEGDHVAKVLEALVARRRVFEQVGLFEDAFSSALDVEWFARAGDLGASMEVLPEVLLRKRVHDENVSLRDVDEGNRILLMIAKQAIERKSAEA